MLQTEIFHDDFKLSKDTPLFKKGDSSLLINYRPISLLPTISNIFERFIHDHMFPPNYPWVDKNRIKVPLGRQFFLKQTSA